MAAVAAAVPAANGGRKPWPRAFFDVRRFTLLPRRLGHLDRPP
jgi:hypothetical protein